MQILSKFSSIYSEICAEAFLGSMIVSHQPLPNVLPCHQTPRYLLFEFHLNMNELLHLVLLATGIKKFKLPVLNLPEVACLC